MACIYESHGKLYRQQETPPECMPLLAVSLSRTISSQSFTKPDLPLHFAGHSFNYFSSGQDEDRRQRQSKHSDLLNLRLSNQCDVCVQSEDAL